MKKGLICSTIGLMILGVATLSFALGSGSKTIATTVTATPMSTNNYYVSDLIVKAMATNSGTVYIGNSTVTASPATGVPLAAGDVWFSTGINMAELYIISNTIGDMVGYTCK